MKIKKLVNVKVKCDFSGCNHMADYSIDLKRGLFGGTTDICKTCLEELYFLVGKELIPTSPTNIIKKGEEKKYAK